MHDRSLNLTEDERQGLARAFRDAFDCHMLKHTEEPTPEELCEVALRDALCVRGRQPDRERGWLRGPRTSWPVGAAGELVSTVINELVRDISSDRLRDKNLMPATPREVTNTDLVLSIFPQALIGKELARDLRILCQMACRRGEGPKLAVRYGITKQAVSNARQKQLAAIARRLRDMMPDAVCHPSAMAA